MNELFGGIGGLMETIQPKGVSQEVWDMIKRDAKGGNFSFWAAYTILPSVGEDCITLRIILPDFEEEALGTFVSLCCREEMSQDEEDMAYKAGYISSIVNPTAFRILCDSSIVPTKLWKRFKSGEGPHRKDKPVL
jgi:hypothetical protein